MKEIPVSPGKFALVDSELFDFLSQTKWYLSKSGYAIAGKNSRLGIKGFAKMHRIIIGADKTKIVDHIDGNPLNNQISNLRFASREQNVHNQKKRKGTKNNYKGTSFIKKLGAWCARCRMNGNDYFLGYYKDEIAAAHAYNLKAASLSSYILLNDLPFSKEYLDNIIISSRVRQQSAPKTSNYNFIYYKKANPKKCSYGTWCIIIVNKGKRTWKSGFSTDKEAHDYLVKNYFHLIMGKPLIKTRFLAAA